MANKQRFVKKHWSEITQKTRNPISLADELLSTGCIHREIYQIIKNQKTKQDQTREILDCLNSEKHFECTYEWLKKNEAELCEELEKSDAEAAAPLNKRARLENEDETDSHSTGFPDLKVISTYSKLERWVSNPENSQKLISDLKRKLGEEGMEALKKELKDKEPKNSLHFNANNIDDVRKNKELDTFPNTTKSTNIPKLTFSMFFKKSGSAPSGNKAQSSFDDDEFMDTTLDLNSSGYESLTSSLNNSWSLPRRHGDMAIISHENKDNESTSKTTEQLHGGSVVQIHHEGNTGAPSQESVDIQDAHYDEMKEQHQSLNVSNVPRHVGVTLYQADQVTKKETPQDDEPQSVDVQDVHIDKMDEEPQRTNVPNVPRKDDVSLCQNDLITKKATPLEGGLGSMGMQESPINEMDEEPQRSYVPIHEKSITQKATPLEGGLGSMGMQESLINEMDEEPQKSDVPMHEESIMEKATPLEDTYGSKDMQEIHINEMKVQPQRLSVPNAPRRIGVTLHQPDQTTKKETPQEDGPQSVDRQDMHIDDMDEEPQRTNVPNVPRKEDVSLCQNDPITKKETPLEGGLGSMGMQESLINEMDEEPQRSYVPMHEKSVMEKATPLEGGPGSMAMQIDELDEEPQNSDVPIHEESIMEKATPLEDTCESKDMQEIHINEMKVQPQRLSVPNAPRCIGVTLHQPDQTTKKETPQDDGPHSLYSDEMDEEPQRSSVPHVPRNKDVSLCQNDPITKKATPLEGGLGSMAMQESLINEMHEEPQRSNVPKSTVSLHQNGMEHGIMNMQQYEQVNKQAIAEPFPSKQLQTYSPGSPSEYTQSNGSEIMVLNKDAAMLAPRDVKARSEATKKREKAKYQNQKKKQEKKKEKDQLLRDWALRQCNGREEDLKDIFDQISIINMAEHSEYPCFTAENVLLYKHLTPDSQIIFIADDNTSIKTKTMAYYHMYVCDVKKAVLLGPKKPNEQEIQCDESKVPIEKCRNLISLAFAPALAVYKTIQKEEKLYSLI